jgi:hypothetical protein
MGQLLVHGEDSVGENRREHAAVAAAKLLHLSVHIAPLVGVALRACQISSIVRVTESPWAASPAAARKTSSIRARVASSGWRGSTVKRTTPGMVVRELGLTSNWPTVLTACGEWHSATRRTAQIMADAVTRASRQTGKGAEPSAEPEVAKSESRSWPA